jgi:hypothetical protein
MVPHPKNPPLYIDLPSKDGQPQPDVLAKWTANAPLAFIDQYIANLRKYRAISIDVGDQDGLKVDTSKLHDALDEYGIKHGFEIYQGTHTRQGSGPIPESRAAIFQSRISVFRETANNARSRGNGGRGSASHAGSCALESIPHSWGHTFPR